MLIVRLRLCATDSLTKLNDRVTLGLYEHSSFRTSRLHALLPIVPNRDRDGIMYSDTF